MKSKGQIQLERNIKEALRTENYKLLRESTKQMYKYLDAKEKARVKAYTPEGAKQSEVYGNELADSILAKQSKLKNEGRKALRSAETEDEERFIRSKMKIKSSDISHLKSNIEIVKRSSERSKEVMLKAMYKEDIYSSMMKAYYGKGTKVSSMKFADQVVNYVGGSKQDGYIYRTMKNSKGKVFEIRTPGYDERNHRFHGFQYREIGENGVGSWIGR